MECPILKVSTLKSTLWADVASQTTEAIQMFNANHVIGLGSEKN